MRIIYGTKVLTSDDIFMNYTTPKNTKDFVKKNLSRIIRDLSEVLLCFKHDSTFQSQDFDFSFIPLDVIEKYIIYVESENSLKRAKKFLITENSTTNLSEDMRKNKNILDNLICKYSNASGNKSVDNSVCVAIICNEKKFKDIKICIPNKIIAEVNKPIMYECEICNHKEYSKVLPYNMYYEIKNGQLFYFCKKCKNKNAVHVGDSFYQKS